MAANVARECDAENQMPEHIKTNGPLYSLPHGIDGLIRLGDDTNQLAASNQPGLFNEKLKRPNERVGLYQPLPLIYELRYLNSLKTSFSDSLLIKCSFCLYSGNLHSISSCVGNKNER